MATNNLTGKYFHGKTKGELVDFTTHSGVRVLAIDGLDEVGDAVNVYTEQWIDSNVEDYMCTKKKTVGKTEVDDVVRKNVDINLTMIISPRYTISGTDLDVQGTYNDMVATLCYNGDIWLKSLYTNKIAHVVCLKAFKPTAVKLHRGMDSYILVTIPFHCIEPPSNI
jgi:hypothetical protein